jgi:hypothetical protein
MTRQQRRNGEEATAEHRFSRTGLAKALLPISVSSVLICGQETFRYEFA